MIQQAMLPRSEDLNQHFSNHFIIFKPRDIVSGDFYWLAVVGEQLFLSVVDCTGHGVPGAFMSMIGNSLLNRLIKEDQLSDPAIILTKLDIAIRESLRQDVSKDKNGMDMSLIKLEKIEEEQFQMTFCGAKSNIYYLQKENAELTMLKADRKTLGGAESNNNVVFNNQFVSLQKGDRIYLKSDGYVDQK